MSENTKIQDKLKAISDLANIIAEIKKGSKTIVLCHGVFDLVHPGHIRHFAAAKREGDILVVTITPDRWVGKGPGRPIFNEQIRAEFLCALEDVDYVSINEWPTAIETIKRLKPNIYCKGKDYADATQDLTGNIQFEQDAIESVGGRICFTDELTFSSTKLVNSNFDVFPEESLDFFREFRAAYSSTQIIDMFQKLKQLKVLIIGETIIDEYHYCSPLGKSSKENLIPAKYLYEETFAGGILAVANHVASFCDNVDLVTCLGSKHTFEEFILTHLKRNINHRFFYNPNGTTLIKRRFVQADLLAKLFEVYYMDDIKSLNGTGEEILRYLAPVIKNYDLVVVGDYGHGLLGGKIVNSLCDSARFLAVNTQTNAANIGFNLITKYPRADFICIDEPEARLATHDNTSDIKSLANQISDKLECNKVVVTRGHRGSLVYDKTEGFFEIPVFSRDVIDRMGAGDAYFSVTSLCAAAGFPSQVVGFIGNAVGALKIRIVGNKSPVEPVPLFRYIRTLLA